MNRRNILFALVLSLPMLLAGATSKQNRPAAVPRSGKIIVEKHVALKGHVFARIDHLTGYFINSLGGQRSELFILGIDRETKPGSPPVPVKVVYEFYRDEPNLPENFFDFSRRYELNVVRDTRCDESVKSLSYEANVSESGKPLPATYVLRVFDGAPAEVLKPDLILPCFVLRPDQYRVVSDGKNL